MKLTKRLLALVTAFAMLCAIAPMGLPVSAAEAETNPVSAQIPTISETREIPAQVNPLYEGIVDPSDLNALRHSAPADAAVQANYVSAASAAEQVRNYMKNRVEAFTVYVKDSSSDYQAVMDGIMDSALAHTGDPKEGDSLLWQLAGEGAYVSWTYSNSKYNYTFEITVTYYTTAEQEAELDTAVDALLSQLNVGSKSDYEKVCAVYDYVCANVVYDEEHLGDESYYLQFTPYAALINKTAVCQGYALLVYRLLLELDVDVRVITGIAGDDVNGYEGHAWNIVELDGLWYNLDATWDAGYDEYWWFLCCTENFPGHYRYMDYETLAFHRDHPISATDYESGADAEPEEYIAGGYCGDDAIWLLDRYGTVTIRGTGTMYDYPYSASAEYLAPWRYWEDEITAVVVEDGITQIGEYTFCREDNLTSVTLPDTLEVISNGAFSYCSSLKQITIPENVTTIIGSAFRESGLTSIVIPDSVTSYDLDFHYCTNLKTVVLGSGITEIPTQAFYDCSSLTDITFRGEITSIGQSAFSGCKALTDFTIPENVTTIARNAFEDCTGLVRITIPDNVSTIGNSIFYGCTSLKEVILEGSPTLGTGLFSATYGSVSTIRFLGAVPVFNDYVFQGVTAVAYYPAGVAGWTEDILQDYGGEITWIASAHDHKYETTVTAPTCTSQGHTTYTCTLCVDSYVDDYTDPLPHTPGEAQIENEVGATCTAKGSYDAVISCTVCGGEINRETIVTDEVPHAYNSLTTAPTCEVQGYTTYMCSACGDTYVSDYTDALGHDYAYGLTAAPTASTKGILTGTCTRCAGTVTVELPALNESDYTYTVITEPTETEDGAAEYTWNVTDYGTVTIPVVLRNLNYVLLGDVNGDEAINIRDASQVVAYYNEILDLTEKQLRAADVNGDGTVDIRDANLIAAYYNGALDTFPADPSHTHSYTAKVTAPTCTDQGYTTYTCSCGETYQDDFTDAAGHNWGSFVTTKEASTTEEGEMTKTCSRCGEVVTYITPKYPESSADGIDTAALEEYGRAYAEMLGFTIDTSMGKGNSSYYPGLDYYITATDEGYDCVVDMVGATYRKLMAAYGSIEGARSNVMVEYRGMVEGYHKIVVWCFYG